MTVLPILKKNKKKYIILFQYWYYPQIGGPNFWIKVITIFETP